MCSEIVWGWVENCQTIWIQGVEARQAEIEGLMRWGEGEGEGLSLLVVAAVGIALVIPGIGCSCH